VARTFPTHEFFKSVDIMNQLDLKITDAARNWLEKNRWSTEGAEPGIVTFVWGYDLNWSNPGWSVGFHIRSKVPLELIEVIAGIEFAFEPSYRESLRGKTIDLVGGEIAVIPNTF
jgi:hypothetical protein